MVERPTYYQWVTNPYYEKKDDTAENPHPYPGAYPKIPGFYESYKEFANYGREISVELFKAVDNYVPHQMPKGAKYRPLAEEVRNTNIGASTSLCYFSKKDGAPLTDDEGGLYWHYDVGLNNMLFKD